MDVVAFLRNIATPLTGIASTLGTAGIAVFFLKKFVEDTKQQNEVTKKAASDAMAEAKKSAIDSLARIDEKEKEIGQLTQKVMVSLAEINGKMGQMNQCMETLRSDLLRQSGMIDAERIQLRETNKELNAVSKSLTAVWATMSALFPDKIPKRLVDVPMG